MHFDKSIHLSETHEISPVLNNHILYAWRKPSAFTIVKLMKPWVKYWPRRNKPLCVKIFFFILKDILVTGLIEITGQRYVFLINVRVERQSGPSNAS